MHRLHYFLVILLLSLSQAALCVTPEGKLTNEQSLYIRAEQALKKHDTKNYPILFEKLKAYPLYPYLIYQELKQKIEEPKKTGVTLKQLKEFQATYPDFPFHSALLQLWLTKMAQNKNWEALVEGYKPSKKVVLTCQYYYGKYQLTQNKSVLEPVESLWLVGYSQPPECDQVFSLWKKVGGFTPDLIWERFRLAIENKNFTLIQHLIKKMSPMERSVALFWENLIKNPSLINNEETLKNLDTLSNQLKLKISSPEILMSVLPAYASINAQDASTWWKTHQKKYNFSKAQINQVYRDIGIQLSRQKSPLAKEWLASLPPDALDLTTQEWRIRLSLYYKEWENALKWIHQLPPYVKQEKSWRYWQARALEKLNNYPQAEIIYKQLAQTRSYYGFLSAMHLKQPLALQNQPIPYNEQATKNVLATPAIARFEQLIQLNKEHLARHEWFRAIEKMTEPELSAAAKIAQKMNLPDYAILTTLKGTHRDDVALRFPLVHHAEILNYAKINNIDPAWVFAISRQESSFYSGTISSAGARGLMQLMPNTAAMLAKQYKIPYKSEENLHDPLTNIQFGTVYLRDLQKQMFDNFIVATASYNAGPTRTQKWLPSETLDADIWIENIPYKETREYVKNVFMFTGIYRQQLGLPSALSLIMKPIPGKVNGPKMNNGSRPAVSNPAALHAPNR